MHALSVLGKLWSISLCAIKTFKNVTVLASDVSLTQNAFLNILNSYKSFAQGSEISVQRFYMIQYRLGVLNHIHDPTRVEMNATV